MEENRTLDRHSGKFILGITGGVGSGKSRILDILREEYGFYVIQADQTARFLMEPGKECYDAVAGYLGPSVLKQDGSLDRTLMAHIIFHDPAKRKRVDELTHPLVWDAMMKEAAKAREERVVIEAAIPSKEFRDNCGKMWYVYTSEENRIERLKAGRGYTEEQSRSIMENQASEAVFRRFCDAQIDNNKSLEETKAQIRALMERVFQGTD